MAKPGVETLIKFLSSQTLDFTNPGFIILRFGQLVKKNNRSIILPEDLLCLIEEYAIKKYKFEGEQLLYSVGKNFAFNYGKLFNFPTIKDTDESDVKNLAFNFLGMIASIWCSKLIIKKFDFEKKHADYLFEDFIVFRKNGLGYSILDGVSAGFFDFFINDDLPESSRKILSKSEIIINVSTDNTYFRVPVKDYTFSNDKSNMFNEIKNIKKPSFNNLINSGLVSYKNNRFSVDKTSFFQSNISFFYILENEFKIKGYDDILFDASFDFSISFFENIFKNVEKEKRLAFAGDFLSAFGYGDVNIFNDHIICKAFPWNPLAEKIDFMIFKGIFSGILFLVGNDVGIKNHKFYISDKLDLVFE